MFQVQPMRKAHRAGPGLDRAVPPARPILLQRLPGNSAQPLHRLWGTSHRRGPLSPTQRPSTGNMSLFQARLLDSVAFGVEVLHIGALIAVMNDCWWSEGDGCGR